VVAQRSEDLGQRGKGLPRLLVQSIPLLGGQSH
jgi:hypothetical protein